MASDYLVFDAVLEHPRSAVWELVGDPLVYPRFVRGVTACERVRTGTDQPSGYAIRVQLQGRLMDVQLRPTTRRVAEKLVLSADPDVGGWISINLADAEPGTTRIDVRIAQSSGMSPNHVRWRGQDIERWVRDGIERVGNYLAREPGPVAAYEGRSSSPRINMLTTLMRSGLLHPGRPDIGLRQLRALGDWGFTLAGAVTQVAMRTPDRVAVAEERGTRTYAELHERTDRLAGALTRMGVRAGATVAVLARNHGRMAEVMIACAKLGVDQVLLNTGFASRPIEETVRQHGVAVLFLDDEFEPLTQYLPDDVQRIGTSVPSTTGRTTVDDLINSTPRRRLAPPSSPGHLIVLTSGTTGTPKGARRPVPRGWSSIAAVLSRIPLTVDERTLIAAPLFHTWGLGMFLLAMALRSTVVLGDRFDPETCLRDIATHRCTSLVAVPIMLQRMHALPDDIRDRYDASSLRVVASSGAALPGPLATGLLDTFGDVLYNLYGSTEVSQATIATPTDLRAAPTTAGRPPLGTTVAILDDGGLRVPQGAIGRIYVGNEQPFDGYTSGESVDTKDAMLDTGDVGYLDADGRLFIAGRDDEMIVSGGENVFPRPVEEALSALPQVSEVAVVGVDDDEYGQRLAAFVVPKPDARIDAAMVRSYVHHRLTRFSVPRDVTFLRRLPRNSTGKVVKRMLVEHDADESLS